MSRQFTQGTVGAVVPASDDGTTGVGLFGAAGAGAAADDPDELPEACDDEPDPVEPVPDTVSEMYFCTVLGSTSTASPSCPAS